MPMITRIEQNRRAELHRHGLKQCSACAETLPIDQFRPNARGSMGLRSRCVECDTAAKAAYQKRTPTYQAARQKRWRDANRDQSHAIAKTYRDTHQLEERLRSGRYRAEQTRLPASDITADELLADWQRRGIDPTRCVYTGEQLQDGWHIDHAVPLSHPNTPGHVVTNLVPCNPGVNFSKRSRHWLDYLADRAEAKSE